MELHQFKSDSEHDIAYKLCKSGIPTLCNIELKIARYSHRHISELYVQKANQIWSQYE
jgi:hypothetical protein